MTGQRRRGSLPRLLKQEIIQDYLSGRKSSYMLSIEHGITINSINKMVNRYKQKNLFIFEDQLSTPIMGRKKKSTPENLNWKLENEELKRQLNLAQLKVEGYQIMGDILQEEYGIDLLKKSEARHSSDSKSDTQK